MAKQFSATVNGNEVLFPSNSVMIQSTGTGTSSISYKGATSYASSSIGTLVSLANTGGTEQVQVSVIRVNDSVQLSIIQFSFPVGGFSVSDSTLSGSSSVVVYQGLRYYVSETQAEILEAANAGAGGGDTLDDVITNGNVLVGAKTIDATDGGLTIDGALTTTAGIDLGGQSLSNVYQLKINDDGNIRMRDTVTQTRYLITIANGALVLTED